MTYESTLWLVRHAAVPGMTGKCYGASDVVADENASLAIAQQLAAVMPQDSAVRFSPLQRCAQLADQLQAQRPDLRFECDARLHEFNFGAWEGRPWDHIPKAEFDRWTSDFANAPPAHGAETMHDFMSRVQSAWSDWKRSGHAEQLWITHAGVIRAVSLCAAERSTPQDISEWPALQVAPGQILKLSGGATCPGPGYTLQGVAPKV